MALTETNKRKILSAAIIVLALCSAVLVYIIYGQLKQASRQVGEPSETESQSLTPSPSATFSGNVSFSYDLKTKANDETTDDVKDVANRFMQAKADRSFEEAKAYMTTDLEGKTNQETFAGASSPSMDRFEISGIAKIDESTYEATVTSYWLLNNEPSGTIIYRLILKNSENDFKVDEFSEL